MGVDVYMSEDFLENKLIHLKDILKYSYYDDTHQLVTVLNEKKLKELFETDILLLNDVEYKS